MIKNKLICHPKTKTKKCINKNIIKMIERDKNKSYKKIKKKHKKCKGDDNCVVTEEYKYDDTMLDKIYAPLKSENELWLSGLDISRVMKQYESIHKDFIFIGPSAIDFDRVENNVCVYDELCNLDVKRLNKLGKNKIGIIFNTDPITKPGKHWLSLFIDLNKKYIFFFDSNGDKIPKEINNLKNRIMTDMKNENINLRYVNNIGFYHQTTEGQCGVYCLYIIIELLGNRNPEYFKNRKISDEKINKYRRKYFNIKK